MKAVPIILLVLVLSRARAAPPASAPAATGELHLTFTEHSPLSSRAEVHLRVSGKPPPPADPKYPADFDLADEPFDLYVPPNYKPGVAHGIFVWVGVSEASREWMDVLARHKLIFLSDKPVNENIDYIKLRKSIDGVHNLKKIYNIDEKRVYVAGFSAGGDHASYDIHAYPEVFRGAVLMMGGGFYYDALGDNGRLVAALPMKYDAQWRGPIEQIKKDTPLVIMRGDHDPVRDARRVGEGRADYEGLLLDGFVRASFIEVPHTGHNNPDAFWFEKAINALDHPELKKPPTTAPTKDPHPLASQVAQAKRYIAAAQQRAFLKSTWGPAYAKELDGEAREYLQQLLDDFPTTPSAKTARQMLQKLGEPTTQTIKQ